MNTFGDTVKARLTLLGISQAELARRIPVSAGYISRILSGQQHVTPDVAKAIDTILNADGTIAAQANTDHPDIDPPWMGAAMQTVLDDNELDSRVARDHDEWCRTRQHLNASRHTLSRVAARLYSGRSMADTGLIYHHDWIPAQPVDLADITLRHHADASAPTLDGTEEETAAVRPRAGVLRRYPRYSPAIRDLAAPRLFENRWSWRLCDVEWGDGKGRMGFADTTYFAGVDVNEAIAHEIAAVALEEDGTLRAGNPTLRDLPFRRLIGDPFWPQRRPLVCAISTLTIRRDGDDVTFLLHRRDPQAVAIAGGMLQVIPSGIFQPSSVMPAAMSADFDLWRNIQREASEELLGNPEHDGDGIPVDYQAEPFATLDAARGAGKLRVCCLGVVLDALTLFGEILTVAVIDADVFDTLAPDFVDLNEEGSVVKVRAPFTEDGVCRLLASGRLAPAGGGCLSLAWQHRDLLLDNRP